jgi:hypothetical protein
VFLGALFYGLPILFGFRALRSASFLSGLFTLKSYLLPGVKSLLKVIFTPKNNAWTKLSPIVVLGV